MYNFEDKSMVILVTSLAYLYNGNTYDPSGLKPDFHAQPDVDLFGFWLNVLSSMIKIRYSNIP
jgi:hypothetical protein